MKTFITTFGSYDELPFSEAIQKELFKRHDHDERTERIIYSEADVLILLQMLQNENQPT